MSALHFTEAFHFDGGQWISSALSSEKAEAKMIQRSARIGMFEIDTVTSSLRYKSMSGLTCLSGMLIMKGDCDRQNMAKALK